MTLSKKYIWILLITCIFTPLLMYAYYYLELISTTIKNSVLSESTHTVILTENGFAPQEITIAVGDTVRFITNKDEAFWPASNVHPEHSLYPSFDPKQPIGPTDAWEFIFKEPGRYGYHDHIFANNTGVIYVRKDVHIPENFEISSIDITACSKVNEYNEKRRCWDGQLEEVMKQGGAESAFDYFSRLYKTEPDVPKECHGWSHTLGKAGYQYYKKHNSIDLTREASACGFGFYHAFLGELMKDTGDFMEAKAFCNKAMMKLPEISQSCKHGIGHGASSMFSENPEFYGEYQSIVDSALGICEKIFTEKGDLTECYDGVYNEVYGNIFNSAYGFDYQQYKSIRDPFHLCYDQELQHKESCYINVVGMFWEIFDRDVVAGMQYALNHLGDLHVYGARIVAKISADRIQESITKSEHFDSIQACQLVPEYLYEDCFGGILNGFIQHGEPNNLHEKGLAFCSELSTEHKKKESCVEELTHMLAQTYEPSHMKELCAAEQKLRHTRTCENITE